MPEVAEDSDMRTILDKYGSSDATANIPIASISRAAGHARRRQHTTQPPMHTAATKIAFWKSAWTLKIAVVARKPVRVQDGFNKNAHIAATISTASRLPRPNARSESP